MPKKLLLVVLLACAGCQTARHASIPVPRPLAPGGTEQVALRLEKYVDTYDVVVQREVLAQNQGDGSDEWKVVSARLVSGYPEKWRSAPEDVEGKRSPEISFLLNGEMVKTSPSSDSTLVAKVLPQTENTARVLGVFTHEAMVVPFDVTCGLGEFVVVYRKGPATPESHETDQNR